MFTTMKAELRELVELATEIARYDATRAAKPDIAPSEASLEERRRKGMRTLNLMEKYELSGSRQG